METKTVKSLKDIEGEVIHVMKKPLQLRAKQLKYEIEIETREGTLKGYEGDYLLEGIDFEVYPVDKSIFFRTYNILNGNLDEEMVEKHKENVERDVKTEIPAKPPAEPDKEEIMLAQIYKKNGIVSIRHSKSAGQFEVFGFLTAYVEALGNDLIAGFEPTDEWELF